MMRDWRIVWPASGLKPGLKWVVLDSLACLLILAIVASTLWIEVRVLDRIDRLVTRLEAATALTPARVPAKLGR